MIYNFWNSVLHCEKVNSKQTNKKSDVFQFHSWNLFIQKYIFIFSQNEWCICIFTVLIGWRSLITIRKFDEIVKRKHQRKELGQIKLIVTENRFSKGSVATFVLKKSNGHIAIRSQIYSNRMLIGKVNERQWWKSTLELC